MPKESAPRVSMADVEAEIASTHYYSAFLGASMAAVGTDTVIPGELMLMTHCTLVLKNGFVVTGESACASPENFDAEVGKHHALRAALTKVWPLLGFRLKDALHEWSKPQTDALGPPPGVYVGEKHTFWMDAQHDMHQRADEFGAAAIVPVLGGYRVYAAETVEDIQSCLPTSAIAESCVAS